MEMKPYERLCGIYKEKNADYKNSFHRTICKYGMVAGLVRISDKYERIQSLLESGEWHVRDESLTDSIGDMATYCVMMAAECMVMLDRNHALDPKDSENTEHVIALFEKCDGSIYEQYCPKRLRPFASVFFESLEQNILDEVSEKHYEMILDSSLALATVMYAWYCNAIADKEGKDGYG